MNGGDVAEGGSLERIAVISWTEDSSEVVPEQQPLVLVYERTREVLIKSVLFRNCAPKHRDVLVNQ